MFDEERRCASTSRRARQCLGDNGMPIHFPRRSFLATAAAFAIPTLAQGQEPETIIALRETTGETFPVSCHAVRLGGRRSELGVVITAVALHPSGDAIAVAGDDHVIRILHTDSLSEVAKLEAHRDLVPTLAFDPSGRRLLSAGNDGQLIIWEKDATRSLGSYKVDQRMTGTPAITCVAFSNAGDTFAAVGFSNVVYVSSRTGTSKLSFECDCNDLRAVTYRDDDGVLAVAGRSGHIHLFDPATGKMLAESLIHEGRVHQIAFHRDSGLAVSVGDDGCVCAYDSETRRLVNRTKVTRGKLFAVTVVDRERVAVAGSDNKVHVVNTKDAVIEVSLAGHQGSVSALAAGGASVYSGGYDASLRRWAIDLGSERIAEVPEIDR